jgi:peptidyl-prolyl cis-trans isomerase B (cyclophilin B)
VGMHGTARLLIVTLAVAFAASASGGCAPKASDSNSPTTPATGPAASSAASETASSEGSKTVPTATVRTSKGTFTITFYPDKAPKTVASFIKLSEEGFYNGNKVHRHEPDFVVQMGDPQTNKMSREDVVAGKPGATGPLGTGGPGFNLPAEFNDEPHVLGTVAMARSQDPNSAGSQFYIVVGPASFLDGQYTVFGKVTEGYDEVASKLRVGDQIESITVSDGQQ